MKNEEMAGKAAQSHNGAKAESRKQKAQSGGHPGTSEVHAGSKPGTNHLRATFRRHFQLGLTA